MKVSKTKLNNLRNILDRVSELDVDIQGHLFDINERLTESIHYELEEIADRIEAEIEILEIDNPELAS
jgi:hypothetical protein